MNSNPDRGGGALLHRLRHFLPSQAPLKDFIHHNTLHAFQEMPFHRALRQASVMLGYRTYLPLAEYRKMYREGRIPEAALLKAMSRSGLSSSVPEWKEILLNTPQDESQEARVGKMREGWKQRFRINLDKDVHPLLFRLVGSYLDQGVAIETFPRHSAGLLESIRMMERSHPHCLIESKRARHLLFSESTSIHDLLQILCGKESLFETYLFDQQFAHPGWSGMVAVLEEQPQSLLDRRKITLEEFIFLELILEINVLDQRLGDSWNSLAADQADVAGDLFDPVPVSILWNSLQLWQNAFEISYHDQVLAGLLQKPQLSSDIKTAAPFQALFCIDDRECSIRRYLEMFAPGAQTYGTPGFFHVEFWFQPEHGKFYTKLCPAPVTPKHLIKEIETRRSNGSDLHYHHRSHGLLSGWLMSQTLGLWSGVRLLWSILFPSQSPASVSSFSHMDPASRLTIENKSQDDVVNGLQIGFTREEMADRVESLLRSIGLLKDFAPLVYVVGHGASSTNNTHYAGYDCGACSGRPGSVNARVIAFMANHQEVREILQHRGIDIPSGTRFLGGLHDTTRDEIEFYDEDNLTESALILHRQNLPVFTKALDWNARERSRKFELIDSEKPASEIHERVKLRSVSLFEPRPELNHATNAMCLVGRREMSRHLFLDRRSFLNSYDYRTDPEGKYLLGILRAVAPVCGGINLEYYFSRLDPYRLGAGTKLPHNVMGLIGVANGLDGDLRTGLPGQMTEVHDPVRLLVVVEHLPEVVLRVIKSHEPTEEWFRNEWVLLAVYQPEENRIYRYCSGVMEPYEPCFKDLPEATHFLDLLTRSEESLPVFQIRSL